MHLMILFMSRKKKWNLSILVKIRVVVTIGREWYKKSFLDVFIIFSPLVQSLVWKSAFDLYEQTNCLLSCSLVRMNALWCILYFNKLYPQQILSCLMCQLMKRRVILLLYELVNFSLWLQYMNSHTFKVITHNVIISLSW